MTHIYHQASSVLRSWSSEFIIFFVLTIYVESNYLHLHYFLTELIGWTIFYGELAIILGIRKKSTHILNSHELHEQSYPTSIKKEYTTICWFFWNRKQLKFVYSMYILSLFFKSSSSNFALNSTYFLLTDRIHIDRDYSQVRKA